MPMIKDKIYKAVERRLYTYENLRRAVIDARAERDGKKGGMEGGGGHAFVSDPTAAQAIKHFTPLRAVLISDGRGNVEEVYRPEKWLYVIDSVFRQLDDDKRAVIKARYLDKKPTINISINYPAGQRTVYNWCSDFVQELSLLALDAGLVRIVKKKPGE